MESDVAKTCDRRHVMDINHNYCDLHGGLYDTEAIAPVYEPRHIHIH